MKNIFWIFIYALMCCATAHSQNVLIYHKNGDITKFASSAINKIVIEEDKDYTIEVESNHIYFANEGGSQSIKAKSNECLKVASNPDWVSVVVNDLGDETYSVEVRADRNQSNRGRDGEIILENIDFQLTVSVHQDGIDVVDLSADANANCYIITETGRYKFNISGYGSPTKAFLLWNENGASDISEVSLSGDFVLFTKESFAEGNALISIADDENILWSWHIWSTDMPKSIENVMDRNLGATSADPNDPDAYGLYYAFGCPFPFPGPKYADWSITEEPSVPEGWYVADGYGFYAAKDRPTPANPMQYCTDVDRYGNSEYWRDHNYNDTACPHNANTMSASDIQKIIGYEPSFNGLNGVMLENGMFFPATGSGRDSYAINGIGTSGGYWGRGVYNTSAVDGSCIYFYEGFSKASSYFRGNTLHSIRAWQYVH